MCETADPQAAITWYQRAGTLGKADGWLHAAYLLEHQGRAGEALACYRRAERAGALMVQAITVARLKNLFSADEEALREAVDLRRPREVGAVAETLRAAGRFEEAIAVLRQAVDEGQLQAVELLAEALLDTGEISEAVHYYKHTPDIDRSPRRWKAAEVLEQAGRGNEAIAWLEERAEGGDPDAATPLISLLERQGRRKEALAWCHHANALNVPVQKAALELLQFFRQAHAGGPTGAVRVGAGRHDRAAMAVPGTPPAQQSVIIHRVSVQSGRRPVRAFQRAGPAVRLPLNPTPLTVRSDMLAPSAPTRGTTTVQAAGQDS